MSAGRLPDAEGSPRSAKEHTTDSYGELRYTVGEACSGGSLADNGWPTPTAACTRAHRYVHFPDADSTSHQILDYALLAHYFGVPVAGPAAGSTLGGVVPAGTIQGELLLKRGWVHLG